MTAEVVNLRRLRKTKRRADNEAIAAANRVLHGQTRAARDAEGAARARATRRLDGHRLIGAHDDDDGAPR